MKFVKLIVLIIITTLLTSCLGGPVKLPPISTYTLNNFKSYTISRKSRTNYTLLVSRPVASSGYKTSRMVYMKIPYKLKSFADSRWVARPTAMLMPLLAQRLRRAGYFHAVVTPPFAGLTNFRLDTRLLILRQEFIHPTSEVRLVMEATLMSNKTNKVIASRRFQAVVKAPGNNPYSGVLAANRAVETVLKQISLFVVHSAK